MTENNTSGTQYTKHGLSSTFTGPDGTTHTVKATNPGPVFLECCTCGQSRNLVQQSDDLCPHMVKFVTDNAAEAFQALISTNWVAALTSALTSAFPTRAVNGQAVTRAHGKNRAESNGERLFPRPGHIVWVRYPDPGDLLSAPPCVYGGIPLMAPQRPGYTLPTPFPVLPEPAASTRCHGLCTWTWRDGRFQLKAIWRACGLHGRYLEAP